MNAREALEVVVESMLNDGLSLENIRRATDTITIRKVLEQRQWQVCKAALRLGIHRNTLTREIHRLHIEQPPKSISQRKIRKTIRERVWGASTAELR